MKLESMDSIFPEECDKVSVVLPILNEERYIRNCLDSILSQDYPKNNLEIILVDGNSEDKTIDIIKEYTQKYNFIKLFTNEKKTVQYALNIGIKNATGKYIVRMDAHASYENDYISKCIEYLKKTRCANVGGTTVVRGKSFIQKIIAAAYHSPFALGGSKHYDENYEGYADTVAWGAFEREYLLEIGMYDEKLPRSEDDDLNFRITERGDKIFVTPKIKSVYYPRDTFSKLFLQYFGYGKWKVAVIKKHHRPSRIAHLIPMLFVAFLILGSMISLIVPVLRPLFVGVLLIYLAMNFIFSFKNPYTKDILSKLLLVWAHFVIHVSYGLGFWAGIFKFLSVKFN